MFIIRLSGSAAPQSNWSPTVNADIRLLPRSSILTRPIAISNVPETEAGVKLSILSCLLLGMSLTHLLPLLIKY